MMLKKKYFKTIREMEYLTRTVFLVSVLCLQHAVVRGASTQTETDYLSTSPGMLLSQGSALFTNTTVTTPAEQNYTPSVTSSHEQNANVFSTNQVQTVAEDFSSLSLDSQSPTPSITADQDMGYVNATTNAPDTTTSDIVQAFTSGSKASSEMYMTSVMTSGQQTSHMMTSDVQDTDGLTSAPVASTYSVNETSSMVAEASASTTSSQTESTLAESTISTEIVAGASILSTSGFETSQAHADLDTQSSTITDNLTSDDLTTVMSSSESTLSETVFSSDTASTSPLATSVVSDLSSQTTDAMTTEAMTTEGKSLSGFTSVFSSYSDITDMQTSLLSTSESDPKFSYYTENSSSTGPVTDMTSQMSQRSTYTSSNSTDDTTSDATFTTAIPMTTTSTDDSTDTSLKMSSAEDSFTSRMTDALPTATPPPLQTLKLIFHGDCTPITSNDTLKQQFKDQVINWLKSKIPTNQTIKLSEPSCGSVIVNAQIPQQENNTMFLETLRQDGFTFTLEAGSRIYNYTLASVEEETKDDTGLTGTQLVIIIVASIVAGVLFLTILICHCVYICTRRTQESFYLGDTPEPHMKLENFQLTQMRRPTYIYTESGILLQIDSRHQKPRGSLSTFGRNTIAEEDVTSNGGQHAQENYYSQEPENELGHLHNYALNMEDEQMENDKQVDFVMIEDETAETDTRKGHDNLSYSSDDMLQ